MGSPWQILLYKAITVAFVAGQLTMLDCFISSYLSDFWLILFVPMDIAVVLLLSWVLWRVDSIPQLANSDGNDNRNRNNNLTQTIRPGVTRNMMVVCWSVYLCNLLLKMKLLFKPARSMSVFDFLGPNTLINNLRLTPVIFFLFYTVSTHLAPKAQQAYRTLSDAQNYFMDNGEIKQLTYDVALDLLDATELYYVFSYFSAHHGSSVAFTEKATIPKSSVVSVLPPQQPLLFTQIVESANSTLFAPINMSLPFAAPLAQSIDISATFAGNAQEVCVVTSNVANFESEWIPNVMFVFTALVVMGSLYAMFMFEVLFKPVDSREDNPARPKRFRWYSLLTLFTVNIPCFVLRLLLWTTFHVSISPLIAKNFIAIVWFFA